MINNKDILFTEIETTHGLIGEVLLNRPKKLNALTLDMCKQFCIHLDRWEKNPQITSVLVRGEGSRAFCAGGDILKLYQYRSTPELLDEFFWHEYRLNLAIHYCSKPYVALLTGLTMGGGAGAVIHGTHRIASPNLQFAMPETQIGLFPDVGASYFLNQCPGYSGLYLSLTGNSIDAATAYHWGLITHLLPESKLSTIPTLLRSKTIANFEEELHHHSIKPASYELATKMEAINQCFSEKSVAGILDRLEQHSNPWCQQTAAQLRTRSPTSVLIAFEAYHRAQQLSFNEIMAMEFNLAQQFVREKDFFEGIRATLIEKDKKPCWQPASLSDVTETVIAKYFSPKPRTLEAWTK